MEIDITFDIDIINTCIIIIGIGIVIIIGVVVVVTGIVIINAHTAGIEEPTMGERPGPEHATQAC